MNRNRWLVLGGAALVLSLVLTFLIYKQLQMRLKVPEETIQVVVASQKLLVGTRVVEAGVKLAPWPKSVPLEGYFTDPKLVVGRGVVITTMPNEPILDVKLATKEAGVGLPSVIPDGMRAISVKVDDVIGVAGFATPGTHVDVIMTGAPKQDEDVASKTILENVQVLAAGQTMEQDAEGKPQKVPVVTLLVSPDQAQELALATTADGKIQLALRNPLDAETKNPAAVQRISLFNKGAKPLVPEKPVAPVTKARPRPKPAPVIPAAAPPADRTFAVEVFLGKSKETVTFTEKIVK